LKAEELERDDDGEERLEDACCEEDGRLEAEEEGRC
jgi:hypothetical protein